VLFECQRRRTAQDKGQYFDRYESEPHSTLWGQNWQFAVLFAAPAPLVALSPEIGDLPLQDPTELGASLEDLEKANPLGDLSIERPTLHVLGIHDEWCSSQKKLYDAYCSSESKTLIEWEGDHRIPALGSDIDQICAEVLAMATKKT
jgi:hypothetical protein